MRVNLAETIRMAEALMNSPELQTFLGAQNEDEVQDLDELVALIKVRPFKLVVEFE